MTGFGYDEIWNFSSRSFGRGALFSFVGETGKAEAGFEFRGEGRPDV